MRISFMRLVVWLGAGLFSSALVANTQTAPVLVSPEAVQAVRSAQKGRPDARVVALERHLRQTREMLDETRPEGARAARADAVVAEEQIIRRRSQAAAKRQELRALRNEYLSQLDAAGPSHVVGKPERHADATQAFRQQLADRFNLLDHDLLALETADRTSLNARTQKLRERLDAWEAARPAPPVPAPNWKRAEPVMPQEQAPAAMVPRFVSDAYWLMQNQLASRDGQLRVALRSTPAQAAACDYTSADLDDTAEAPKAHADIVALARQLDHNPVRMFEWVQQNIAFEPYYGSLKGAVGALWSKSGGATDQASLLVALLRASNIPARYVRGQVSVLDNTPQAADGRAPRWIGAKTYQAAANVLGHNGNPSAGTMANPSGQVVGVNLAHVWVQACLPYAAYRGTALDDSGHRWIPLDPAFKDQRYQAGISVDPLFDFNYPTWLSRRLDAQGRYRLPQEAFEDQVEAHAKTKAPGFANNTLEDVPYKSEIKRQRHDILPIVPP